MKRESEEDQNEITSIEELSWYHGNIPRTIAENALLAINTEGVYLLRKSDDGSYSLSLRSQDAVKHYKLHHFKSQGVYVFGEATFYSLKELLEHFESKPLVGTDGNLTDKFLYPYHSNQNEPIHTYETASHQAVIGKDYQPSNTGNLVEVVSASKEGFLVKRGNLRKSWKRRWFVVNKNLLKYYESKKAETPIRTVDLKQATEVSEDYVDNMDHCFRLVLPNRTFYFVANSGEEADEWKNLLHWKIEYYRNPDN